MPYLTSSGNQTVDAMASVRISGNVIPQEWYKVIVRENGKPHLLAITLLSDIVYWYRPVEIRDEYTGEPIGWQKRFKGDYLQKSYQQYADFYGESRRTIKAAMDLLENMGLIRKIFRDLTLENGQKLVNVMFIDLDVDVLKQVTYPEMVKPDLVPQASSRAETGSTAEKTEAPNQEAKASNQNTAVSERKSAVSGADSTVSGRKISYSGAPGGTYKISGEVVQNFVPPPAKKCTTSCKIPYEVLQNNVPRPAEFCGTNTENTTEITTQITTENMDPDRISSIHPYLQKENPGDQSDPQRDMALIRKNLRYDEILSWEDSEWKAQYMELYGLVRDTICSGRKLIYMSGGTYTYQQVRDQFMRLTDEHLGYVIECINRTTSKIENIRSYMLRSLYNAPDTFITYTNQAAYSGW